MPAKPKSSLGGKMHPENHPKLGAALAFVQNSGIINPKLKTC
jgi:hypothetical protein